MSQHPAWIKTKRCTRSERDYINPLRWMAHYGLVPPHITYDPKVVPQYRIIRGHTHDGTLIFFIGQMWELLSGLLNMTSYYKPEPPAPGSLLYQRYVVGTLRVASLYGPTYCQGKFPGMWERYTLPVRCIPVLDNPDHTDEERRRLFPFPEDYGQQIQRAVDRSYGKGFHGPGDDPPSMIVGDPGPNGYGAMVTAPGEDG